MIKGKEMKTLYEKYCYLNQMRERKIDDEDNIKLLKKRGFKIEEKKDAMMQCYSHVKLKQEIPTISNQEAENKSSLELFIKNCCQLTKFDNDFEEVVSFILFLSEKVNKCEFLKRIQCILA